MFKKAFEHIDALKQNPDVLEVREMTVEDQGRVSEILCSCYRQLAEREGFTNEQLEFLLSKRGSVETVRNESQTQTYLVAAWDEVVVGVAAVKDNEITKLYVDPAYHRQGVGRKLFEAAETVIRDAGLKEATLGAMDSAVPFYEAMGMRVSGRKTHAAGAFRDRDVAIMTKPVDTRTNL